MNIIGILCISSGANEVIEWTQLGLMCRDCALSHCETKDALGLWTSLIQICTSTPNPYFLESSQETIVHYNVSPIVSASLCAMSSLCSLMLGYVIAHHYHKKVVYTQVKMEDDF